MEAAHLYARLCNEWGRRTLIDGTEAARALELLEPVADGAEPAGLPLFAAWRALPRPGDVPGRLAQVMNVMREHRGSVHACAVAAVGLGPLEATLAGSYGEAGARFGGWAEPYPSPEPYKALWEQAEELTSVAAAAPFAVLSADERAELAGLLPGLWMTNPGDIG
jgi:hypothetical protein